MWPDVVAEGRGGLYIQRAGWGVLMNRLSFVLPSLSSCFQASAKGISGNGLLRTTSYSPFMRYHNCRARRRGCAHGRGLAGLRTGRSVNCETPSKLMRRIASRIPTDDDPDDRPVVPGWEIPLTGYFESRPWHALPALYAYDLRRRLGARAGARGDGIGRGIAEVPAVCGRDSTMPAQGLWWAVAHHPFPSTQCPRGADER
jgi:hypothetical protein